MPLQKPPRETIEEALGRIEGLKSLSPSSREFIRWQHETALALKEIFGDDSWMVFKDIPVYDYKKIMGFYAKSFTPEAYAKGLGRLRDFLERKLAELK